MDATDVSILRVMGVNPFGPTARPPDAFRPSSIAKALKLSTDTVRARITRLEENGVILGYQLNPNPRHFGLATTSYLFKLPDARRPDFSKQLPNVEGILAAHFFLGGDVCIDLCYRGGNDLNRHVGLLSNLAGDQNPAQFFSWQVPPVSKPLTQLDWRIIRALRRNAKRPLPEVAKELNVPYRTVKRRYDAMCKDGSVFTVPIIQPALEAGLIPFWLCVYLRPDAKPEALAAVLDEYRDRLLYSDVPPTTEFGHAGMLLVADTPAAIESLRRRGAQIPGVEKATVYVASEGLPFGGWIDELIAERAGKP